MLETIIPDPKNGKSKYHGFSSGEFEYEDPYHYLRLLHMTPETSMLWELVQGHNFPLSIAMHRAVLSRVADSWDKAYLNSMKVDLSKTWIPLLSLSRKKDQVSHLKKNSSLTSSQFLAFLLQAGESHGFKVSQYRAEYLKGGVEKSDLPRVVHLRDDGSVDKIGETVLCDGELKNVIEHRHVTIAKFLDKGTLWHCLFITYKSMRGKEKQWKDGQPHMHYVSSGWGLSRDKVVSSLRSEKYGFGSTPHIDYFHHE